MVQITRLASMNVRAIRLYIGSSWMFDVYDKMYECTWIVGGIIRNYTNVSSPICFLQSLLMGLGASIFVLWIQPCQFSRNPPITPLRGFSLYYVKCAQWSKDDLHSPTLNYKVNYNVLFKLQISATNLLDYGVKLQCPSAFKVSLISIYLQIHTLITFHMIMWFFKKYFYQMISMLKFRLIWLKLKGLY